MPKSTNSNLGATIPEKEEEHQREPIETSDGTEETGKPQKLSFKEELLTVPEEHRGIIQLARDKVEYLKSLSSSSKWQLKEEKNGVKVYTFVEDGITCTKGVGEIKV